MAAATDLQDEPLYPSIEKTTPASEQPKQVEEDDEAYSTINLDEDEPKEEKTQPRQPHPEEKSTTMKSPYDDDEPHEPDVLHDMEAYVTTRHETRDPITSHLYYDMDDDSDDSFSPVIDSEDVVYRLSVGARSGKIIAVTVRILRQVETTAGNRYILYQIASTLRNGNKLTVERRFSDFLWLRERLRNEFPGVLIPLLPPKKFFGRFQEDFLEKRRRFLEIFIRSVMEKPAFEKSPALLVFLGTDEETFGIASRSKTFKDHKESVVTFLKRQKLMMGNQENEEQSADDHRAQFLEQNTRMMVRNSIAMRNSMKEVVEKTRELAGAYEKLSVATLAAKCEPGLAPRMDSILQKQAQVYKLMANNLLEEAACTQFAFADTFDRFVGTGRAMIEVCDHRNTLRLDRQIAEETHTALLLKNENAMGRINDVQQAVLNAEIEESGRKSEDLRKVLRKSTARYAKELSDIRHEQKAEFTTKFEKVLDCYTATHSTVAERSAEVSMYVKNIPQ